MEKRGTPIKSYPQINNTPINLMMLYALVMRAGGSRQVSAHNFWPKISASLGFPSPDAISLLIQYYNSYLLPYEEAWLAAQQQQKSLQQAKANHSANVQSRPKNYPQKPVQTTPEAVHANGSMHGSLHSKSPSPAFTANRFSPAAPTTVSSERNAPPYPSAPTRPTPPTVQTSSSAAPVDSAEPVAYQPIKKPIDPMLGYPLNVAATYRLDESLLRLQMPSIVDLGTVNIQALCMSLQSTLEKEITYAMNVLLILTNDQKWMFPLSECQDVVDALIDVATQCLDNLLSVLPNEDLMEIADKRPSYRQLLYNCCVEISQFSREDFSNSLSENKTKDSINAIDVHNSEQNLLAVFVIFRNLSHFEANQNVLVQNPDFFPLLIRVVKSLNFHATSLLRSSRNTLDLHKDVLIVLCQLSQNFILPNVDVARHVLLFILSFSPFNRKKSKTILNDTLPTSIPSYTPATHPYAGPAINAYAKLLAKDANNKTNFQAIFDNNPKFLDSLFLLLASVVPKFNRHCLKICERRLPLLQQSFFCLAATVSYVKQSEQAANWCNIGEGFFVSMLRLLILLSGHPSLNPPSRVASQYPTTNPFRYVIQSGISTVRRLLSLVEAGNISLSSFPKSETLLAVLLAPTTETSFLKEISNLLDRTGDSDASLENTDDKSGI